MGTPRHALNWLVPALIGLPVAAGLAATLLGAVGIIPGLAGGPSLAGWRALLDWPGLRDSVSLTLRIGLIATALSTLSALCLVAAEGRLFRLMRVLAAPVLAAPHAAVAIGVGFLIAPTGLLARLVGLTAPWPLATVPGSGAVILALWLKETPFLLLMALSGLGQTDLAPTLRAGSALGQSRLRTWLVGVLPRLWPQLRLPVAAALAFSLSVTDVAIVLGPQTPPPLAVAALRWSLDPDLSRWPEAAAAAVLLLSLVALSLAGLWLLERTLGVLGQVWARRGGGEGGTPEPAAAAVAAAFLSAAVGALVTLVGWAGAASWRFPAVAPAGWSPGNVLGRLDGLARPAATTLWLGVLVAATALVAAVAALAAKPITVRRGFVWLPLLLPQSGFLFGVQTLLVAADLDGSAFALVWAHLVFVLPYVLLALIGPFAALDPRYARTAAALGASPARALWRVTLPLLRTPLLTAAAVGFAVSVGLYLPTLFAAAGRVATLATEAVTLSAGGDRRVLAATALAQAALPWAGFAAAFAWRAR